MTKIDYETKFAKMSLDELVAFCEENDDDWNSNKIHEWAEAMEVHLGRAFSKLQFSDDRLNLNQLIELGSRLEKIDLEYLDLDIRDAMKRSTPVAELWDQLEEIRSRVNRIEASAKVLLLKLRTDDSGATVEQMNKIKGGIPIS